MCSTVIKSFALSHASSFYTVFEFYFIDKLYPNKNTKQRSLYIAFFCYGSMINLMCQCDFFYVIATYAGKFVYMLPKFCNYAEKMKIMYCLAETAKTQFFPMPQIT